MKHLLLTMTLVFAIAICALAQKPQTNTAATTAPIAVNGVAPVRVAPSSDDQLEVVRLSAQIVELQAQLELSALGRQLAEARAKQGKAIDAMVAKLPKPAAGKMWRRVPDGDRFGGSGHGDQSGANA